MMMLMNLLNGDEYACFVVLRLGYTIYYKYFNGFNGEFGVITYRNFSTFSHKIHKIMSIYFLINNPKSCEFAKVEPRNNEGSLY